MSAVGSDRLKPLGRVRKALTPGWHVINNGTAVNQGLAARAWNHLSVLRIPDTLMAGFGAVIGAQLAGIPIGSATPILPVVVSLMALSGASMAFNDWKDYACDQINERQRALPSGRVSRPAALGMAQVLFLLGIAFALGTDRTVGLLAIMIAGVSIAYSMALKSIPLLGNIVVGIAAASPLWIWLPLISEPGSTYLIMIAGLALMNTAREIARTAEDITGDRACGVRTLSTRYGAATAARVAYALALMGLLLCWVPWWTGNGSWIYLGAVAFSTLLGLTILLRDRRQPDALPTANPARLCRAVTVIMALGCFWGLAGPV